ncbi:unnamed protein product [Adineta ricciae]|uniref:Uncharacterized protein n=1 Tax=Adineta ricciae TaxID=249248 RepID=A0A814PPW4_ADIRI|nr:unnamed protein product [Adineta ricciae]CAF1299649.1 unnamed protein product [Adineta ricciae]
MSTNTPEELPNCEQCSQQYNLFRRRKQCQLCGQTFCSKCTSKSIPSTKKRACPICLLIINDRTTHEQLGSIRIKHLRAYLIYSKIITSNRLLESCFEKQDLINLIQSRKQQTPDETYVFVQRPNEDIPAPTPTIEIPNNVQPQPESVPEPLPSPPPSMPIPSSSKIASTRKTLADLSSLESIQELTVGQLKDVLNQNFVSYKGCVEKHELIAKLQLLYRDKQQQSESNTSISNGQSDENLCKICMDESIDCVFLDCGHLCTCIRCGKQLSECPLCRSYIVRVVRVFKS